MEWSLKVEGVNKQLHMLKSIQVVCMPHKWDEEEEKSVIRKA